MFAIIFYERQTVKLKLAVILLLAVLVFPSTAKSMRYDSGFWNQLDETNRIIFIIGMRHGAHLGLIYSTEAIFA